jgi:hypothetical protein
MPRNSRSHETNVMNHETDQRSFEASFEGMHEVARRAHPFDVATMSDKASEAPFAPEPWLRMLQEYNLEILKTYADAFWMIPALCLFPLEVAQRSFTVYIKYQQCMAESFGQRSTGSNLAIMRVEGSYLGSREPVNSIERAMDVVIGDEGEPPYKTKTARAA